MCLIGSKEIILLLKQCVSRDLYKKIEKVYISYLPVYNILYLNSNLMQKMFKKLLKIEK